MIASTMAMLVLLLSTLGMIASISLAIDPETLISMMDIARSSPGIYVAVFGYLLWGTILYLAGPVTKFPRTFKVMGALYLLAGLIAPFIPVDIWVAYIDWWIGNVLLLRIVGSVMGILFCSFLIYGSLPRDDKTDNQNRA